MVRRPDFVAVLVLLAAGLAYQLVLLDQGVGLIDEGHLANAARRLARGEILYRDVYTVYPPASFHVVAGLFRVLGEDLFVLRGFHVAATLGLAVLVFAMGRRLMAPPFAWLAGGLVAMTGWRAILEGNHYAHLYGIVPASALALLARADARGPLEPRTLVQIGMLAGLALAFRLEPFVGLALASGVVVLVRAGSTRRGGVGLAALVAGTLVVVSPIGLYYALHGALDELLRAVFWTSFGQYWQGGEFNLPMPPLQIVPEAVSRRALRRMFISWEFRIPVVLYAIALVELLRAIGLGRRARPPRPVSSATLQRAALALFGSVLYLRATGRSDYYHLAPTLFPAYLLGCDGLARIGSRLARPRLRPLAWPAVGALMAASLTLHQFDLAVARARDDTAKVEVAPGGPRIPAVGALDDLIRDVRARTRADEPIVVLPWYPIVYFLADRPNPTRFDWLFPGYLTTEADVEAFLERIDRADVRVVVYSPISIDGLPDRSLSAFAPGIHRHLMRAFRPERRYGRFWLMTRAGGSDAPAAAQGASDRGGLGPGDSFGSEWAPIDASGRTRRGEAPA
ncbi:MAG: hypothetical protein R3F35_21105 [Myxococcota bacterium]